MKYNYREAVAADVVDFIREEINTSDYNTGIYFFNIQTENGNFVQKVIKR